MRTKSFKLIPLILLIMAISSKLEAQTTSSISFDVSFIEPQAHYAEVKMTVKGIEREYIDIKMPVWTPGSYLVREYSKNVESVSAVDAEGKNIDVKKISKNTWRVFSKKKKEIQFSYRLYGFEVSVRTNYIDDAHAFLSPAATFMYVDGYLNHPSTVTIHPHKNWSKVSTGLDAVEGKAYTYYAPDFDILFDTPIEVGNQEVFTFEASGVLHEVAMVNAANNYDVKKLIADFTKIIEEETRIWGVNPNKRYVFIVHHFKSGGGGLEHLNSTVLGASRNTYTNPRAYSSYLGLVAHEYFHLWLVKRLRPIELGPFDYDNENYTTGLWIMEGFTSYYDNLILRRTGLVDERAYLQLLQSDFDAVENKPGNKVQPVALASMDAWIKYYRPDENSNNTSISYYNKGALLAMLMDVKIIAETKGKYNLDHVLKAAYEEFYVKKQRGFEEPEFEAIIKKVTGIDVSEIFRMAHTTETIDYNYYLNKVGFALTNSAANNRTPSLGAATANQNGKVVVNSVTRGSTAWDGGLNVRDEIIAINGERVDAAGPQLNALFQQYKIGDQVKMLIARDGLLRELTLTLKRDEQGNFSLTRLKDATSEQQRLGDIWLSIK